MPSLAEQVLTAGYASAVGAAIAAAPNAGEITDTVQTQLQKSFTGAEQIAEQYPEYADAITAAATSSFLDGADWAYFAGIIAILIGAAIVSLLFLRRAAEQATLARYHEEDTAPTKSRQNNHVSARLVGTSPGSFQRLARNRSRAARASHA